MEKGKGGKIVEEVGVRIQKGKSPTERGKEG